MWKARLRVITFLCWVMCAQHQRTREHWHTKPVWQIVVGFFFLNSLSASRGSRKNTNTPGQTIKPRHPGLHSHVLEDSPSPPAGMKTSSYLSALPPNNSRRYVTSTMLVISRSKTTSEPVQRQNAKVIISLLICESASFLCASLKKKKRPSPRQLDSSVCAPPLRTPPSPPPSTAS